VPYWNCDNCGVRLYSASDALRWKECPVCEGRLVRMEVVHSGSAPGADADEDDEERREREVEDE